MARHARRAAHSTSRRPSGGWLRRPREGWLRWYLRQPRRQLFDPERPGWSLAFWGPVLGLAGVVGGVGGVLNGTASSRAGSAVVIVLSLAGLASWCLFMARPATIARSPGLVSRLRHWWRGRRRPAGSHAEAAKRPLS